MHQMSLQKAACKAVAGVSCPSVVGFQGALFAGDGKKKSDEFLKMSYM